MIPKAQAQRAGDNSNQYQVAGDLVVVRGVTEARALEIATQAAHDVMTHYSAESQEIAMERIGKFDIAMVKRLADGGLLGALADPAMQVTLRKAQLGAASSERESDYDLLASLIEDRVKRGAERPVRSGINRAVEIVDQIDDTALTGLTAFQAGVQYQAVSPGLEPGLTSMETLLAEVMEGRELPTGVEWIEHLDVLGAIRADSVQDFNKFDDFWPKKTPGYVAVGVEAGSPDEERGRAEMARYGLGLQSGLDHEFKPGFRRLPFASEVLLAKALRDIAHRSDADVEAAIGVANEIFKIGTKDDAAAGEYMRRVRARPNHARLAEWWDGLPTHFTVTPVGRVLARANVQRLDSAGLLPPLE